MLKLGDQKHRRKKLQGRKSFHNNANPSAVATGNNRIQHASEIVLQQ